MKLNELLNIQYPLIQGGMANIATGEFAASVSNAGALGLIGAGGMDSETLKKNIAVCRELTDKPFGVNIMLLNPYAEEMAQIVIDEKVPVVTTGAGNPATYIAKWKEAGIKVFPVVPSVALAKRLARHQVDGLIVEGTEAGGHIGELTTMSLVPQIIEVVDVPVIAAGGIATGRQLLAAYALGACGVQVGTCLLASEECPIHVNYKKAIIKAKDTDTTVTGRISGTPVRIIKNKMAKTYVKKEKEGASMEELEVYTLGSLRKAVLEGDIHNGSLMAGQVSGLIKDIVPVKTIIEKMFIEYREVYQQLPKEV
jgi:enoyl-[acyl-carrier protein] reductase II